MNTNRAKFFSGYRWIITGLISGMIFYLFFGAILPGLFDETVVERSIPFGFGYWSLVGIGVGALTKLAIELGYAGNRWIIQGLLWGLTMFAITNFAVPYFGGEEITMSGILIGLIVFSIGGLGYGYAMKMYVDEHTKKAELSR